MKTKTLAQVDGIIGIIAGAVLAILPVIIVMIAAISENEDFAGFVLGIVFLVFTLVKNCNSYPRNSHLLSIIRMTNVSHLRRLSCLSLDRE